MQPWVYRRALSDWYFERRNVLVPLGRPAVQINVPTGQANFTGLPPTSSISPDPGEALIRSRWQHHLEDEVGVYRHYLISNSRVLTLPVATALSADINPPTGLASFTGFSPSVQIKSDGEVFVPLGQATFTGFAPQVKTGEEPGPEPEPKPAGRPYLLKRRRRFILPDGRFFDGTDSEALERLRQFLNQQAKEDQLTRLKEERPRLPLMQEPEDVDVLEAPTGPPVMMTLPELRVMQLQIQAQRPQSIDPQLVSVLLQRIDDEEAAMLLL